MGVLQLRFTTAIILLFASFYGIKGTTKNKYIGCYEDRSDIRLFDKNVKVSNTSVTNPNPCVHECGERAYPYAGISEAECYCSHDVPSEIIKTSDLECDLSWLKKFSDIVYPPRLAAYETGVAVKQLKPAKIYIGCFRDENKEFRLFKGFWQQFPVDNTPTMCHGICVKAGFKYFGLTYKEECFCGDARPSEDVRTDESDCNLPCTGNPNAICGGGWILSVYATGITDVPSDGRYVGCYKNSEEDNVFLSDYSVVLKTSNSPRRCLNICDQLGHKYAGVQNRDGCYCGNQLPPNSTAEQSARCNTITCAGDPTECTILWILPKETTVWFLMGLFLIDGCYCGNQLPPNSTAEQSARCNTITCAGDPTDTCGSKQHIKVYRTRKQENKRLYPVEFLGCFSDKSDYPILEESKITLPRSLTIALCIDICQNRGYPFAGIKFGKHCQCDFYYPSLLGVAPDEDCRTPCPGNPSDYCGGPGRSSMYYTGITRVGTLPGSIYKGCYRDDNKVNRLLKGSWQELENDSPRVCQRLCYKTGYFNFGLTWIKECFCGDENPSDDLLVDENECNKPCGGDSNKKCGGGWRTTIYQTGLTDIPVSNRYIGCFTNSPNVSQLSDYVITLSRTNTPQKCLNICDQLKYGYSGLENGVNCRCGYDPPNEQYRDNTEMCDSTCPGDANEICGKRNKIRVYRTSAPDKTQAMTQPPDIIERVDDIIVDDSKCGETYTTKNKKRECKGRVIFEDNFSSLNSSVWKHTVKLETQPDFPFVIFVPFSNVSYLKDGKLNIKPLVQSEEFVDGSVTLSGCTGKLGTQECSKTANSFNILPPILSARITTENSFTFRYGIVDIQAKLPLGNWIVPEIWLMPKEMSYGENYMSGQIRIAMARGNKQLKINGTNDISNDILEVGIYVGLPNNVKRKVFRKQIKNGWSNDFHNYSLTWTPDNMSFKVDNEVIGTLIKSPEESVYQITGQPPNADIIWNKGSKLAPFDREFYISLGVSVGGIRDFPDSCGPPNMKKPWLNQSPKAMLNFWQAQSDWQNTWSDDKTKLEVNEIRVRAL